MVHAGFQCHSAVYWKLIGPTAGPDFRPDASRDTVARRPKNQLAKPYEYKSDTAGVSTANVWR
jgi:hypothetical protein